MWGKGLSENLQVHLVLENCILQNPQASLAKEVSAFHDCYTRIPSVGFHLES